MKNPRSQSLDIETMEPLIVLSASCGAAELVIPHVADCPSEAVPHDTPVDSGCSETVAKEPVQDCSHQPSKASFKSSDLLKDACGAKKVSDQPSKLVKDAPTGKSCVASKDSIDKTSSPAPKNVDPKDAETIEKLKKEAPAGKGKPPQGYPPVDPDGKMEDPADKGGSKDVAADYRTYDGAGNNKEHPSFGAVGSELLRLAPADYSDGVGTLAGQDRPGPREISNLVHAQQDSILSKHGTSDFLWAWGQFIDHDLDLTEGKSGEQAPIAIPKGDRFFDPTGTGTAEMDFERSEFVTDHDGVRQHKNDITAFVDASQIYGSDKERADYLREHEGGRLLMPDKMLQMSLNDRGQPQFDSGDVRAGENIMLTSLHTLFSLEHNRIAEEIALKEYAYQDLSDKAVDEAIFQRTRAIIGAQMQEITYEEFLPALLGEDALSEYSGYDAHVNPGIATEFSTAAFRVGHTMVSPDILRVDPYGQEIAEGHVALRDAFFDASKLIESGIDPILRGAATQHSQEIDPHIIDDLRNFLFGPPGSGGFDLASLNLQRGRDHGLASYNDTRVSIGLDAIEHFEDISSDPLIVDKLKSAYDHVDDIDLWTGGLSEDHHHGAVGETFHHIIKDQFERLRDGDRYWHDLTLSDHDLQYVEGTKLSDIIKRNTSVDNIQSNVFYVDNYSDYA